MRAHAIIFVFLLANLPSAQASPPHPQTASGTAVVREMNLARQHPEIYAGYLKELRGRFQGRILLLPGKTALGTDEGVGAVDE
ncbi:MAG: CAP domain-containing protein, partial [Chthoniobacterales bacterium]|nr:CAP domain-containing protein [Chthoniobacterales bacterium]